MRSISISAAVLLLSLVTLASGQNTAPNAAAQPSTAATDAPHATTPQSPQQTAWTLLSKAATDHKDDKRQAAVLALSTLGSSPRAIRMVEKALLNDKEVEVRQTAASALAEMKAHSALPTLRNALDDKSAVVRFAAAKALWDLGDHSGRDVLIEVLEGESSPSEGFIKSSFEEADKKLHNPHELAMMGINEASGAFLGPFSMGVVLAERMAKDKTAGARALSATLLASDHDPRSVRDIDVALQDKNWAVREAAAKAIGHYPCKAVLADLEPLLDDKKEEVKLMAAASILKISAARRPAIPSECSLIVPTATPNATVRADAHNSSDTPPRQP